MPDLFLNLLCKSRVRSLLIEWVPCVKLIQDAVRSIVISGPVAVKTLPTVGASKLVS